ncbi:MAG TPA: hypothetical protein VM260_14800, partial [Pirellula sp.]|nr:hypothetical protein [Pirellula sp.]
MPSTKTQYKSAMKQCDRQRISIVAVIFACLGWAGTSSTILAQEFPANGYTNGGYPAPTNGQAIGNYGTGSAYSMAPIQNPAIQNGQQPVGQPMFGPPGMNISPQQTIAPPTYNNQPVAPPSTVLPTAPPLEEPWQLGSSSPFLDNSPYGYNPRIRDIPVDVYVQEGQTGRFSVGGSVNSDLGVAGNFVLEERNFDIRKFPSRPSDLLNGAFRGAGQNFRVELVPG